MVGIIGEDVRRLVAADEGAGSRAGEGGPVVLDGAVQALVVGNTEEVSSPLARSGLRGRSVQQMTLLGCTLTVIILFHNSKSFKLQLDIPFNLISL